MWEFLDRLLTIALPRIRDFRGLSPQASSTAAATTRSVSTSSRCSTRSTRTASTAPRGMDITVVTTATTDDEGRALLRTLGFPFKEA